MCRTAIAVLVRGKAVKHCTLNVCYKINVSRIRVSKREVRPRRLVAHQKKNFTTRLERASGAASTPARSSAFHWHELATPRTTSFTKFIFMSARAAEILNSPFLVTPMSVEEFSISAYCWGI